MNESWFIAKHSGRWVFLWNDPEWCEPASIGGATVGFFPLSCGFGVWA